MRVVIQKELDIDDEAAASVMADFVEWMESLGVSISADIPSIHRKMGGPDWTWSELAAAYVAERVAD